MTIIINPKSDFLVSFSFKIKYENTTEATILNLSIEEQLCLLGLAEELCNSKAKMHLL